MSAESLIQLTAVDVTHETGGEALLHQVSWQIDPGTTWVVVGARSSGKTSLLATAAGLNQPKTGTVQIFGRNLAEATEDEQVDWRKRIGFAFENGGRLLHQQTVAENVALPLEYHLNWDEQQVQTKVAELLDRAGLANHADTRPSWLSTQAQQRVSLVRALAVPVDVLFLDSPTRGASPREERWWLELLKELSASYPTASGKRLATVISSDDLRGWNDRADHFAWIQNGEFCLLGGREELTPEKHKTLLDFM